MVRFLYPCIVRVLHPYSVRVREAVVVISVTVLWGQKHYRKASKQ